MKCNELEEEYLWTNNVKTPSTIMVRAYNADDVDKAIAELKHKLEDAKAPAYAEGVDAGMRERRLKRALWIARAERAKEFRHKIKFAISSMNTKYDYSDADKWEKVERKCLKKAEEYK